ncbi:MAG: YHS domain-containing protein, partial [Deltaproteobacteria bacterium]|nr:YHS domain-containing protein [Deltaproteobacteria bacterium]
MSRISYPRQSRTDVSLQDPVCGMTVEPDGPHRTLHAGISYGFCGARCLERFRADPEHFLAESPSERSVEGPGPYTCPMHPEIVQDEFGTCPICGMALEPMEISAAEEANPELEDMLRRFKFGL